MYAKVIQINLFPSRFRPNFHICLSSLPYVLRLIHHTFLNFTALIISGDKYNRTLIISGDKYNFTLIISGDKYNLTVIISGDKYNFTLIISGDKYNVTLIISGDK
jgi:hypothetical protein